MISNASQLHGQHYVDVAMLAVTQQVWAYPAATNNRFYGGAARWTRDDKHWKLPVPGSHELHSWPVSGFWWALGTWVQCKWPAKTLQ